MKLFGVLLTVLAISGCATPQEYSRFRYVGEKASSEDQFTIDREHCRWEAPPVPIAEKYVYRGCMVDRGWIANE